jgi:hypothetical protein
MKNIALCLLFGALFFGGYSGKSQAAKEGEGISIAPRGDSVLSRQIDGKIIRVVISASEINIGSERPSPEVRKTNCLYTRRPCSQVTNASIWINGVRLFVPRSVFADRTDLGLMSVARTDKLYVLTLTGGDGAEAYTVKIYFDLRHVKKRELYSNEANSLVETTTYMLPAVLN